MSNQFFGSFLFKFIDKLEHDLPYGELIGQLLRDGMVTEWQYYELESIPNIMKRRRDTVMLITKLPPEKVEQFCYLIKENQSTKKLGKELLKACHLRKHQLIENLKQELEKLKEMPNVDLQDLQKVNQLEIECALLKNQLKKKEQELKQLNEMCEQLRKDLEARRSNRQLSKGDSKDDSLYLGAGNFGVVQRVKYQKDWCAGKTIHSDRYIEDSNAVMKMTATCKKFFQLDHPHVEAFKATQSNSEDFVLLTEMFPENLDDFVKRCWKILPYSEQLSLIQNMADGLQFLHQNDIIHSNLHGRNVLISHDRQAKIGDYICPQLQQAGLIHKMTNEDELQAFIAPELSKEQPMHTNKSDVFALGVLCLQVLTQAVPSIDGSLVNTLDDCNPAQLLVNRCLSENSASRPDCVGVCDLVASVRGGPQYIMYNCLHGKKELPSLVHLVQKNSNQIKWIPITKLPVKMHSAYAAMIDDCLYVTGGVSLCENVDLTKLVEDSRSCNEAVVSSCVFKFDIFSGNWSALSLPKHKSAVPHVVRGKLVLVGGLDLYTNKTTNHVSVYNPQTKSLTNDYPNLKEQRCFPAVVSWGDYVIVAGGKQREDKLDDIEVLHTTECHWTKVKTLLPRKMYGLSATVSNDTLYLTRTFGIGRPSTSVQVYYMPVRDVIRQSQDCAPHSGWSSLPDVPFINATIVPDAYPPMIVGGSDLQGNTVDDILCYNVETKSWKKVDTLSSKLANTAVTTISNHAIVVLGGCGSSRTRDDCRSSAIDTVQFGYIEDMSPLAE